MGMLARYIAVSEDELNRLIDLGDEPIVDEIDALEEKTRRWIWIKCGTACTLS